MGLGNYVKALLISISAYAITIAVSGYDINNLIEPPPPPSLQSIVWFFTTIAKLVGAAVSLISFPMLPEPFNWIMALIFGGLFIYGSIGIFYYVVKLVKPFS